METKRRRRLVGFPADGAKLRKADEHKKGKRLLCAKSISLRLQEKENAED